VTWGRPHAHADEDFRAAMEQHLATLSRPRRRAFRAALTQTLELAQRANEYRRAAGRASDQTTKRLNYDKAKALITRVKTASATLGVSGARIGGLEAFEADMARIAAELDGARL
jgi:hypothetical protein